MLVKIKSLTGKQYVLDKDKHIKIIDLKNELLEKHGVNVSKFCYSGKVLKDNLYLNDYDYNENNFIIIIPVKKESTNSTEETPEENISNTGLIEATIEIINSNQHHVDIDRQVSRDNITEINEIMNNPELIQTILSSFSQNNPIGSSTINTEENTEENEEELNINSEINSYLSEFNLSYTQESDINELISLGFSRDEVLHIYVACNKNKELSANLLIDDQVVTEN